MFLAKYVPKCQMSSGPCGTILEMARSNAGIWEAKVEIGDSVKTVH